VKYVGAGQDFEFGGYVAVQTNEAIDVVDVVVLHSSFSSRRGNEAIEVVVSVGRSTALEFPRWKREEVIWRKLVRLFVYRLSQTRFHRLPFAGFVEFDGLFPLHVNLDLEDILHHEIVCFGFGDIKSLTTIASEKRCDEFFCSHF